MHRIGKSHKYFNVSDRLKYLNASKRLHVHSVNFAAKLVHARRALFSTAINSHQELVSGQACNPLDPHWFLLSFLRWKSFTVLGTKVAPFNMGSGFHCLLFFFFLFSFNRQEPPTTLMHRIGKSHPILYCPFLKHLAAHSVSFYWARASLTTQGTWVTLTLEKCLKEEPAWLACDTLAAETRKHSGNATKCFHALFL
jgi:hypothetical protein